MNLLFGSQARIEPSGARKFPHFLGEGDASLCEVSFLLSFRGASCMTRLELQSSVRHPLGTLFSLDAGSTQPRLGRIGALLSLAYCLGV